MGNVCLVVSLEHEFAVTFKALLIQRRPRHANTGGIFRSVWNQAEFCQASTEILIERKGIGFMNAKLHEPADSAVIDVWRRAPKALRAEQIKTGRAIFGNVILRGEVSGLVPAANCK